MATNRRNKNSDTPPDWEAEALVPHRALWEVAAMAGNVEPNLSTVRARKASDPNWATGYNKIVRLMTNALSSSRSPAADHIYYEPHRSSNAALIQNLAKAKQVRIEVASAIEFLWHMYGDVVPPKGFQLMHKRLRGQRIEAPAPMTIEERPGSHAPESQPPAMKSSAYRDQKMANATKEIKRLGALVHILASALFSFSRDSEVPPVSLLEDVAAAIKSAGLQGREGFGPDGIQRLLEQSLKHYFELKR